MNGITSMQRSSTSYADYGKFASGKKVNRAADGAAELAIIQKRLRVKACLFCNI